MISLVPIQVTATESESFIPTVDLRKYLVNLAHWWKQSGMIIHVHSSQSLPIENWKKHLIQHTKRISKYEM